VLLNELKKNYALIVAIKSFDHFVDFAGNKFMGSSFVLEIEKKDKNWRLNWEQYVTKLSDVNQQLSNLINRCIDEERLLWVVGY
jgi:hypothetical protein